MILLFGVGAVSGFMNVVAGGGSTLTLPALIFLGLTSSAANGTNRIAILAQNISAIYSFHLDKYSNYKLSLKLSLFTLPGAIAGAVIAVNIDDDLFQTILGIIMIGVVISMLIPNPKANNLFTGSEKISWLVYVIMGFIGFYIGFIQAGVGFIIMAVLFYLMKMNLITVNMHKVFIVFIAVIPSLIVFVITNNVNWLLGIILAAGNASGAWWAAKLSIKKGEKFIRIFLMVTILIMALKLFKVF
jgi:uncharacterized membrane protein YfcA